MFRGHSFFQMWIVTFLKILVLILTACKERRCKENVGNYQRTKSTGMYEIWGLI